MKWILISRILLVNFAYQDPLDSKNEKRKSEKCKIFVLYKFD